MVASWLPQVGINRCLMRPAGQRGTDVMRMATRTGGWEKASHGNSSHNQSNDKQEHDLFFFCYCKSPYRSLSTQLHLHVAPKQGARDAAIFKIIHSHWILLNNPTIRFQWNHYNSFTTQPFQSQSLSFNSIHRDSHWALACEHMWQTSKIQWRSS